MEAILEGEPHFSVNDMLSSDGDEWLKVFIGLFVRAYSCPSGRVFLTVTITGG